MKFSLHKNINNNNNNNNKIKINNNNSNSNTGAPNEYFSENEPLTTENENLDAFKAFSSAFLCCWKEFICSSLPAG